MSSRPIVRDLKEVRVCGTKETVFVLRRGHRLYGHPTRCYGRTHLSRVQRSKGEHLPGESYAETGVVQRLRGNRRIHCSSCEWCQNKSSVHVLRWERVENRLKAHSSRYCFRRRSFRFAQRNQGRIGCNVSRIFYYVWDTCLHGSAHIL